MINNLNNKFITHLFFFLKNSLYTQNLLWRMDRGKALVRTQPVWWVHVYESWAVDVTLRGAHLHLPGKAAAQPHIYRVWFDDLTNTQFHKNQTEPTFFRHFQNLIMIN